MELILVRHPAVAAAGLCYGRSDVALAEPPQAECARLIVRLTPWCGEPSHPPRLYSSPLSRCASIAQGLSAHFGTAVEYDARLQEMDFGRWEGMAWDRVPRAEIDAWAADVEYARPHGGENVAELAARAGAWLDAGFKPGAGADARAPTVVLTHAGPIRVLAAQALQMPLAQCLDWQVEPGACCRLRRRATGAGWTLLGWNMR